MKKFAVLIGILICFVSCKKKEEKIKFLLDWTPNTNHTGLYVAQNKGYFKEEGLEVEILPSGNDSTREVINGGGADFGVSFQPSLTQSYNEVKDFNVVALAAILQDNTSGYLVNKKNGIFTPKDLVEKNYGGYKTALNRAIIKELIKSDGGKGDVIYLNSYSEEIFKSLESGVDLADAYLGWEGIEIKIRGLEDKIGFINLIDYKKEFQFYSPIIIGNKKYIVENPEKTKKFMRALKKGYEFAAYHPEESAEILLKEVPGLNKKLVIESQKFLSPLYIKGVSYWGYMKEEVWKNFTNFLKENDVIRKDLKYKEMYTNKYLEEK